MKGKILAVLIVAVAAIALLSAGTALAGITSTKHNLSPTGPGTIHATGTQQNGEICVWCHTPHSANTAFTGAPLWNKATPSGSYTMYGATIAGTPAATAPGGVSKACLSCHDGVNAINSIVNEAGTGGIVAGGANVAFGATAAGTALLMTGNANIGQSLADDHPISIPYTAPNASLYPTTTAFGTSTIAGLLISGTTIECSSCHDPHVNTGDAGLGGVVAGAMFLRKANTGSALCLTCHNK